MFGAISTAEIAAKLAEHGIELERKRIHLGQGPVKLLGKHVSTIRLHANVTVEQEFEVISENPIEDIKEVAEESDRPERDKKPRKQPRSDKSEKSDKKAKTKK